MSENFFESIEFANLLDVIVLLVVVLVGPLLWSARSKLSRRQSLLLFLAYGFMVLSLGLATYQTAYVLFTQFPRAPSLAHYFELFTESIGFWLFVSFFLLWQGAPRWRLFFFIAGAWTLIVGTSVGIGGWQRTTLLQGTFHFRPEAEIFFAALKLLMVFVLLAWFMARQERSLRLILAAALLIALREGQALLLLTEPPFSVRIALTLYAHGSLAAAAVLGGLALGDLEAIGVRTRAFRVLIFGFVVLSTVVVALSFNYLLRDRLLDEAFGRFGGEAEKIGNDVSAYLRRLETQVRALAAPDFFDALALPDDPQDVLASLPQEFLLEDFESVGFFDPGGKPRRIYSVVAGSAKLSALGEAERRELLNSHTGTLALAQDFTSHGSLFYELDGLSRIREDRPTAQPALVFAALARGAGGAPAGYVEAVFPTARLGRFFAGYGSETGWDFLATGNGLLLAHGRSDYVGYDLSRFEEMFTGANRFQRWHRITLPGGSSYVVLSPLGDRQWVVGRVLSTQAMLTALRKLRGETLTILIVTLAVTTIVALFLSGFVNRQRMALERMTLELDHKAAIEAKNVELSVERQKIETILLSIGEGVLVCDAEEKIVFVNAIAQRMLRVREAEWLGRPLQELGLEPMNVALAGLEQDFQKAANERQIKEFPLPLHGLDLRGNIAPLMREGERYQGAVIILQDISELMKLDRLKTEILSIVSHSLRTPLTSIKSFTEILQDQAGRLKPEKEREYLSIIDFSTDRLTRIVNNILDLSKIAGGKMGYSFRPTDLSELLEESAVVASGAAQGKGIRLATHWNGAGLTLNVDRPKMMQVFDNLLGNAVKFTPQGGQIEISLRETTGEELAQEHHRGAVQPGGKYALVAVRDTGVGISSANLERIFDQFFQDDYVRQSNEGGTGLGLAISKEYVVAHGGLIWAESRPKEGSTFFVALPL